MIELTTEDIVGAILADIKASTGGRLDLVAERKPDGWDIAHGDKLIATFLSDDRVTCWLASCLFWVGYWKDPLTVEPSP